MTINARIAKIEKMTRTEIAAYAFDDESKRWAKTVPVRAIIRKLIAFAPRRSDREISNSVIARLSTT